MRLEEIIRKYNLKLLLTFGSYGTERFGIHSDIDIAYESNREIPMNEQMLLLPI